VNAICHKSIFIVNKKRLRQGPVGVPLSVIRQALKVGCNAVAFGQFKNFYSQAMTNLSYISSFFIVADFSSMVSFYVGNPGFDASLLT